MTSKSGILVAAVGLSLFLYAPLRHATFVYDDLWRVVQNPALRTWKPLSYFRDRETVAMPGSGLATDIYNPLTTLSLAVDYRLFGLHAFGYHLENFLWHLVATFLFGWILWRLTQNGAVSMLAAFLFLVHPVQVQSVAWISQRSTVLSAVAELVSFAALLGLWKRSPAMTGLGLVAFVIALFIKESAITLPFLYAITVWWQRRRRPSQAIVESSRTDVVRMTLVLLTVSLSFLFWRAHVLGQWAQEEHGGPQEWRLGLLAWPVYVGKLFVPIALRPSYRYPEASVWVMAVAVVTALGTLMALAWSSRRKPVIAVGLGWMLVALAPALHLVALRTFVGERFLYLPMMGFAALVAAGLLHNRWTKIIGTLWILFLITITWRVVPTWTTESRLWEVARQDDPQNAFAQACYAGTRSDPQEAVKEYRRVLDLNPEPSLRYATIVNLAHWSLKMGRNEDARQYAETAVQLQPGWSAEFNLCVALWRTGHRREALALRDQLIARRTCPPGFAQALAAELRDRAIEKTS